MATTQSTEKLGLLKTIKNVPASHPPTSITLMLICFTLGSLEIDSEAGSPGQSAYCGYLEYF